MNQHKTPCKNCPYKRTSIKGYLGTCSNDPQKFLSNRFAWEKHECHATVDYDAEDADEQVRKAPTCAGFAIMCKNEAKRPYNETTNDLIDKVSCDRDLVFSNTNEFINHHHKFTLNEELLKDHKIGGVVKNPIGILNKNTI